MKVVNTTKDIENLPCFYSSSPSPSFSSDSKIVFRITPLYQGILTPRNNLLSDGRAAEKLIKRKQA